MSNKIYFKKMYTSCAQEKEARQLFQQLLLGLDYCHKMGVANRDIKLENVLLSGKCPPVLKLTDFGFCKHDRDSAAKTVCGTLLYMGMHPQLPGQHCLIYFVL